jgi:hypothetical protein
MNANIFRHPSYGLVSGIAILLSACAGPTDISSSSARFTAVVSGAITASISGDATVASSTDSALATGGTPGPGTPTMVIGLVGTNVRHAISFVWTGTTIPAGTYPIRAAFPSGATPPTSLFQGSYLVQQSDGDMQFLADSGSVTITSGGSSVIGEFVLFASSYQLWELPTSVQAGSPVHLLGQGTAPVKISGSFDAVRR